MHVFPSSVNILFFYSGHLCVCTGTRQEAPGMHPNREGAAVLSHLMVCVNFLEDNWKFTFYDLQPPHHQGFYFSNNKTQHSSRLQVHVCSWKDSVANVQLKLYFPRHSSLLWAKFIRVFKRCSTLEVHQCHFRGSPYEGHYPLTVQLPGSRWSTTPPPLKRGNSQRGTSV